MRQSKLFTKTTKQAPRGEESKNAQLLERAGFVYKNLAGVYSYLPLGYRVLTKIIEIIRQEMNKLGGQEVLLGSLQDPEVWKKTGRWDDKAIDIWFKTELHGGGQLGLASTHEDPITELMTHYVRSYQDLPFYAYQFQTKFRNELRAKSGLMRVREFIMKDLYSFSASRAEFEKFYEECKAAYLRIFEKVGLGDRTFVTYASGKPFTDGFSHEFQTLSEAGEDTIYLHEQKQIAINKEVYNDKVLEELGIDKEQLTEKKAIEIGNIFPLETKYSDSLGLKFTDKDGKDQPVFMGSYGIGPGRVMGTIVETHNDDNGIIWPESVAPFSVHLLNLAPDNKDVTKNAESGYERLTNEGIEVLLDDRDVSAGEKFADADLIGIPFRAVISGKTGDKIEFKKRSAGEAELLSLEEVISKTKN